MGAVVDFVAGPPGDEEELVAGEGDWCGLDCNGSFVGSAGTVAATATGKRVGTFGGELVMGASVAATGEREKDTSKVSL